MPTPVGHTIIGAALGCGVLMPRGRWKAGLQALWEQRAGFLVIVFMANLPDIDYLPGVLMGSINVFHHWYTHTLGWIAVVSLAVWILWRKTHRAGWSVFALLFAALASHLAVDLFSADHSVPYGIMALWPFTDTFYISPEPLFWSLRKGTWNDVFQWYNVQAALYEAAVLLPVLAGVLLYKRFAPARGRAEP